ncbi:hypothetical protein GCM10012286_35800 [Streptomyces lasiicapitis]|uniref:Streptomycin biosynthesis protein n=1 Tax=Streptomyces lasiicapitis TaxID=1923961 RepID=A0ABQ2M2K1_9ACTN|nr:hypothetical protein GCM10012286_35800 [Streptomyces lasiicapitis]
MLAESEAELPPILVHRPTMRVIDGMHRLRAALLRGVDRIDVMFVQNLDGRDLFLLAVKANVTHGLPLTLADRRAAAARIVVSHPQWSDRAIAMATGLAAKTVRAIRDRTTEGLPQPRSRTGQDGKVRPLNSAEGRRSAGEILRVNPDTPLRQVALRAGISLGTASDVRKRLRAGEDLVPPQQKGGGPAADARGSAPGVLERDRASAQRRRGAKQAEQVVVQDPAVIVHLLMRDPALRFTESGRSLLRWLNGRRIDSAEWQDLLEDVPPHCTRTVANYARQVAESWAQFAEHLDQREQAMT